MAELHPSAFVETVGCKGPRYTRNQPSRESAGVLYNECESKYGTKYELPYRNIKGFLDSLDVNWGKLDTKQRGELVEYIRNKLPQVQKNVIQAVTAQPTTLSIIRDYILKDPKNNTQDLLNAMYYPQDAIKQVMSESQRDAVRDSMKEWGDEQSIYYHTNWYTLLFLLLCCLLVALVVKQVG